MNSKVFRYVLQNETGLRLDQALTSLTNVVSRSQAQRLLKSGFVLLNGEPVLSPSRKVNAGQEIKLTFPPKKYADILIVHEGEDDYFSIALNIYYQFISELKLKKIPHQNKNYVQVWETMTNTIINNPKVDVCRSAIKLLHQTSVQRSK